KETVPFVSNYDSTREEPKVLPAKLPNLLLNGTVGIAVGMATNIPPHNLSEVVDATTHLIDNPEATTEQLMKFIAGPDFPTGGVIYNKKGIIEAYRTGRGPITCRAVTEIEERKAGQFTIIVRQIPYQVNKAELITKIAELVEEKKIEGIRDLRDESDREEQVRIVIELKTDAVPQKILNQLYKHTDLEKDFHLNMIALAGGIQPQLLSLKEVLAAYIEHRYLVVHGAAKYDLRKAKERVHILEGLVTALDAIDSIIATIKKSKDRDNARANLMKNFKLTEIQANAILEIRLQTLAALERQKIEDELALKKKLIRELEAILGSSQKIFGVIKTDLAELKKTYGDPRRTTLHAAGLADFKEEDLISEEETVIMLSESGYVKRMAPAGVRQQRRGGTGLLGQETGDRDFARHFLSANTHDSILFFTNRGRVFQTKVYEIPQASRTSKGKLIQNFLNIPAGEDITAIVSYSEVRDLDRQGFLVMATKRGLIKKTALADFANVRRNGIIAIALKNGDALQWARLSSGNDEIVLATGSGQAIRFKEAALRPIGRGGAGVRAIKLKSGDYVAGLDIIQKSGAAQAKLLVVTEKGFAKQTSLKEYKVQSRGGQGIKTAKITGKTGRIIGAKIITDEEELLALSGKGQIIKTKIAGIRSAGRATSGVRIMKLREGDAIVGVVTL
ncbi:DNA gyrase subunit A, partial [Candidatus Wolfebacteria bacterium]|nr:DNA gyrase subunit A [Candidatus Wolfebacteria bacterium]